MPTSSVQQWGVFELDAPSAEFRHEHRTVHIDGFEDGDGIYKLRFMPDAQGRWDYSTPTGQPGSFEVTPPSPGNHGPVRVANTFHFAYADGTPYVPIGTTCYAWTHQGDALETQTLATLRSAPFNKMRMCIFPKHYAYNNNEPEFYPFIGDRFNPQFFRHLERRIQQLGELGIEADLILFHPYDHWGYSTMPPEKDDRYLRYVVARFAAYRNVWWSLANEFDLMKSKQMSDWDRFFRIVEESDPYGHLRSIHYSRTMYDQSRPWVTHVSMQDDDFSKTIGWRDAFRKPLLYDECKYEGNIRQRWGNISARELVRRFWLGVTQGAYVGHGETYLDPHDILWWSKGGVLHGESPQRIAFLRRILEQAPPGGLNPASEYYPAAGQPGRYYLYYFDYHQPNGYEFDLPPSASYKADLIDPWEMTITPIPGSFRGKFRLSLPGKPYLAARLQANS
ncbi:MAG TPA: DUF5605 domain-containing protein [Bryobacteraceae bacterium]